MPNWNESKIEALKIADLLFELANIAFDVGADDLALTLENDARAIEKHYTYNRQWAGTHGKRRR